MNVETTASILTTTLALGPSVVYATLGEIVGERAGIVNLGIEGVMLVGAAFGFAAGVVFGNSYVGLLAGAGAGCAFNMLMAVMVVTRRTNQLATGFALYFLGLGVSTLVGDHYIGSNVGGLRQFHLPGLGLLPHPWSGVFDQDAMVWLMVPTAVFLWWAVFHTRWGLRLRAVGEDRTRSYSAGLHPGRIRYQALAIAGALSGLSGAHLAVAYTKTWQDGITGGRGFICIAIVILALWQPVRAIPGALLFTAAVATGLQLQVLGVPVSPFLLDMLPYAVTIAVVLIWGRPKAFAVPAGLQEVFVGTST